MQQGFLKQNMDTEHGKIWIPLKRPGESGFLLTVSVRTRGLQSIPPRYRFFCTLLKISYDPYLKLLILPKLLLQMSP